MSLKLYRVTLRGLSSYTGLQLKTSYVVAENPHLAYTMVQQWLDKENYGFLHDREMETIELLAENVVYPDCRTRLFLTE